MVYLELLGSSRTEVGVGGWKLHFSGEGLMD